MKVIGIIPSRYASSRFPGKPLAPIKGKTLIRRVWERASKASALDALYVATDDARIRAEVASFGGKAVMTPESCRSGTDRLAAAARKIGRGADIVVNIQGDEPLIPPALINAVALALKKDAREQVSTAVFPLTDKADIANPNIAKVAVSPDGHALFFSRSAIPFNRDGGRVEYYKHIGIYGYRKAFLFRYARWPQTPLEKAEQLEQLRILESGGRIKAVVSAWDSTGVDLPSDVRKIERQLARMNLK